jgi:hypothetical protein
MSNKSAYEKLTGHGRVICEKCGKVIITCRCMECSGTLLYDVCDDCIQKVGE